MYLRPHRTPSRRKSWAKLNQPGSLGTSAPTSGKMEESSFCVQRAESDGRSFGSVVATFRSKRSAELPQVDMRVSLVTRAPSPVSLVVAGGRTVGRPTHALL